MTTILVDNCDVIIAEMNLRGSRCQCAAYCNRDCCGQCQHWKEHKELCQQFVSQQHDEFKSKIHLMPYPDRPPGKYNQDHTDESRG